MGSHPVVRHAAPLSTVCKASGAANKSTSGFLRPAKGTAKAREAAGTLHVSTWTNTILGKHDRSSSPTGSGVEQQAVSSPERPLAGNGSRGPMGGKYKRQVVLYLLLRVGNFREFKRSRTSLLRAARIVRKLRQPLSPSNCLCGHFQFSVTAKSSPTSLLDTDATKSPPPGHEPGAARILQSIHPTHFWQPRFSTTSYRVMQDGDDAEEQFMLI